MTSIPETLNRELVIRLVLSRYRKTGRNHDTWAMARDVLRALDHWSEIPARELQARQSFLAILARGCDY